METNLTIISESWRHRKTDEKERSEENKCVFITNDIIIMFNSTGVIMLVSSAVQLPPTLKIHSTRALQYL